MRRLGHGLCFIRPGRSGSTTTVSRARGALPGRQWRALEIG
ncbi:Hypothetical protein AA314_10103 [Archangium gephyra]|uniref:Uncharacterized protein n=1 Tax=Archangium gephyra TaxID=48 RepID=A0AAC8TJP4_9BACT|nr:Hypothetical protein AA314_10103 [Archangium gephyra]